MLVRRMGKPRCRKDDDGRWRRRAHDANEAIFKCKWAVQIDDGNGWWTGEDESGDRMFCYSIDNVLGRAAVISLIWKFPRKCRLNCRSFWKHIKSHSTTLGRTFLAYLCALWQKERWLSESNYASSTISPNGTECLILNARAEVFFYDANHTTIAASLVWIHTSAGRLFIGICIPNTSVETCIVTSPRYISMGYE